jgi:hypothetical protein
VTVMATPTSKSGTAHFTLNSCHVKKFIHSFFMSEPRIFCTIFTNIFCLCIIWLCWFSTCVCSPGQNFVTLVLNKEMSFHTFGSLPTIGEEVLLYFKVNITHGDIPLIFFVSIYAWSHAKLYAIGTVFSRIYIEKKLFLNSLFFCSYI